MESYLTNNSVSFVSPVKSFHHSRNSRDSRDSKDTEEISSITVSKRFSTDSELSLPSGRSQKLHPLRDNNSNNQNKFRIDKSELPFSIIRDESTEKQLFGNRLRGELSKKSPIKHNVKEMNISNSTSHYAQSLERLKSKLSSNLSHSLLRSKTPTKSNTSQEKLRRSKQIVYYGKCLSK